MIITRNTQFIIYGAGVAGKIYSDRLREQGFKILAYLDCNAEKIKSMENTPVYVPDNDRISEKIKKKAVVLISLTNVFKHGAVAEMLYKKGYIYLVYKVCNLFQKRNRYYEEVNAVYENITNASFRSEIEGFSLPEFEREKESQIADFIGEFESVNVKVPGDLLFGVTEKFYKEAVENENQKLNELIPDKSLYYFTISKDLMAFFSGTVPEKQWETYIRLYHKHRNAMRGYSIGSEEDDKKEFEQHLRDRYEIFQNMELRYALDAQFFEGSPSEVKWNSKGYFNIEDGNNRAAFLFAKGLFHLPCRMHREDYDKWLHKESLDKVIEICSQVKVMEYPIPHPYFEGKLCRGVPFVYYKLKSICEFLYLNEIKLKGLRVLDIECKSGYFGQHFNRMGADVTAIDAESVYCTLSKAVNELLYANDIEVLEGSCTKLCERQELFQLLLAPEWVYDRDKLILHQLEQLTERFLILDIGLEYGSIQNILERTGFNSYKVLNTLVHYGRVIRIVLFIKGEISDE